jgi:predicted transcriptional regulator
MDREYSPAEANAWLAGYEAGKAFADKELSKTIDFKISETVEKIKAHGTKKDMERFREWLIGG